MEGLFRSGGRRRRRSGGCRLQHERPLMFIEHAIVIEIGLVEELSKKLRHLALFQELIFVRIEIRPVLQQRAEIRHGELGACPWIAKPRRIRQRTIKPAARTGLGILRSGERR